MISWSAAMTSSRSTRTCEPQLQLERFRRRLVAEDVGFGRPGFGLGGLFPDCLARNAAVAGDFLDQGDHFLRVALSNYLQKQ